MLKEILALFDWTRVKMLLRKKRSPALFKEGEIWWCKIGRNLGTEIYGKGPEFLRPVIIFKKFNDHFFFGIPLTTRPKEGIWYVSLTYGGAERWALLSQARSFDGKRLVRPMGALSLRNFENIRSGFSRLYLSESPTPRVGGAHSG